MTDALTPDRVLPLLRGRLGRDFRYFETCASTQLELSASDSEGAVAVAEYQHSGRGRLGREWQASPGSALLVSVLLRPPSHLPLPQLSLVAGVAVARTVESISLLPAAIKWPNDVLVSDGKVAGILAEGKNGVVVLGIGLNVNQTAEHLPVGGAIPAASLRALDGRIRDRALVLGELLFQLEQAYDGWTDAGLGTIRSELSQRDWLLGREITIDGTPVTAAGIREDGSLLVRDGTSLRAIASGDIVVRS